MSQGNTNVLETDVVIFQMRHQEAVQTEIIEEADKKFEIEESPISVIKKDRFARLKRSLRKKSVSIL